MQSPETLFISATLSLFAVRTLKWGNGHSAWSHGSWKLFSSNPPSCRLPAEDWSILPTLPRESMESQASTIRTQTAFCPSSTCARPLPKDYSSLQDQLPIDNYALPSLYTCLFTTGFFSLCAFRIDIPKREKKNHNWWTSPFAFVDLPECHYTTLEDSKDEGNSNIF